MFNGSFENHLFKIDIILSSSGTYIILTLKTLRARLLKRQTSFFGKVSLGNGNFSIDERLEIISQWANSIDLDELKNAFLETGRMKPIITYENMIIDFNTPLESVFEESLLDNSWKKWGD
jgi:hypothetical protein